MTLDEAIAEVYRRVPKGVAADHAVPEIRLQIYDRGANVVISRDTFSAEPLVDDFYGTGRSAVDAIMNAVASYETTAAKS